MEAKNLEVSALYDNWISNESTRLDKKAFFKQVDAYLAAQEKEICGKCVPCRDGVPTIRNIFKSLGSDSANENDVLELEAIVKNLRSSRCSIGLTIGKNLEVILRDNFDLLTCGLRKEEK